MHCAQSSGPEFGEAVQIIVANAVEANRSGAGLRVGGVQAGSAQPNRDDDVPCVTRDAVNLVCGRVYHGEVAVDRVAAGGDDEAVGNEKRGCG